MNMHCAYAGRREAVLVEYLYNDMEATDQAAFAGHLPECAACRAVLDELHGVRSALRAWTPPQPASFVVGQERADEEIAGVDGGSRWLPVPAWARAAAAVLVIGAAAGLANLDIHYNHDGLSIHTGWSRAQAVSSTAPTIARDPMPWRGDLTALAQQLRSEFHAAEVSSVAPNQEPADALLRRVRTLVDESERRQRRELALRVAEMMTDVNAQRQADLQRIGNNIGAIANNTGIEAIRQRQVQSELLGYIQRVSQQK